jgi:nucleotide-binding universal stress UspA family protein
MGHHWSRICCPVDFSETSWEALAEAAELAARGGEAHLVILHVEEGTDVAALGEMAVTSPEAARRLVEDTRRSLERCRAEAEQIARGRVAAESVAGDPASEIVRFAERQAVDLIVMGTHGRTGIRRILLGSVAERVVRSAPCSVLVVRPSTLHVEPD